MLRVSKLTDYATVLLGLMAETPDRLRPATDLAEAARLELPTVSKVLKLLAGAGLVESQRGAAGGYRLALPPERIALARIVEAIDGPISVTQCAAHAGQCSHEAHCGVRGPWQRISLAIERSLRDLSLAQMLASPAAGDAPPREIPIRLA